VGALRGLCERLGIEIRHGLSVSDFAAGPQSTAISLSDGSTLESRLLIACDGVRSALRDMAGIKTVHWAYDQSGIVTTVEHERPHEGCAEEHFLPSGPFAILPLKGNRSSLVWTERTADADRLVASDDLVFEEELERRFGHKLGPLRPVGPRRAFPLGLTLARSFVAPRFALAGDAAHGIHPISGQGLNLGFKDVAALAETVVEADRLGLDIGSLNVLERYQSWRRFDTLRMGVTTDVLNRLFSNDIGPIRVMRDFGLGVVDRLPGLKSYFIGQAAGTTDANAPRLLAGEAL
jgi:2-octaprenyl-6-methoxyphenol hydroxylase